MERRSKPGRVRERRTSYFAARLPEETREGLERYARLHRISASAAAAHLLEEGLRAARFPGIDFRWEPSGRRAHVTGTGLAAWEMHMLWVAHGRDAARVLAAYPHLTASQVLAGAAYIEAYPEEGPPGGAPAFAQTVRV
ncbi:MAG: DUF433 domain-containing protein [Elusimicrobia bacterium]|nr:DUF433 domain-containing protein [Elusimicrobiota bacterium]